MGGDCYSSASNITRNRRHTPADRLRALGVQRPAPTGRVIRAENEPEHESGVRVSGDWVLGDWAATGSAVQDGLAADVVDWGAACPRDPDEVVASAALEEDGGSDLPVPHAPHLPGSGRAHVCSLESLKGSTPLQP